MEMNLFRLTVDLVTVFMRPSQFDEAIAEFASQISAASQSGFETAKPEASTPLANTFGRVLQLKMN